MIQKTDTQITQICVISDSPSCRLAIEWRKAFTELESGAFEIHWAFLSRPWTLWRTRNKILLSDTPIQAIAIGWLSSVLTCSWLPKKNPLILAGIVNQDAPFIPSIIKRCTALIQLPSKKKGNSHLITPSSGFQLVCRADMVAGSGVLEVIWAFTMVRLAGWPCTLWIAGEGPLLDEFRIFAKLASIHEDIRFLPGFRNGENFPTIPDILLMPSQDPSCVNFPEFRLSKILVTAKNVEDSTNTSPNCFTPTITIPWKPHHICRVIIENFSRLNKTNSHQMENGKDKNLSSVILEIANQIKKSSNEVAP